MAGGKREIQKVRLARTSQSPPDEVSGLEV